MAEHEQKGVTIPSVAANHIAGKCFFTFQRFSGSFRSKESPDDSDKENDECQQKHHFGELENEEPECFSEMRTFCHAKNGVNNPIRYRLEVVINQEPNWQKCKWYPDRIFYIFSFYELNFVRKITNSSFKFF